MSRCPGIDIRRQPLRYLYSANGIAARTDGVVEIPFLKVGHVSNPPIDLLIYQSIFSHLCDLTGINEVTRGWPGLPERVAK